MQKNVSKGFGEVGTSSTFLIPLRYKQLFHERVNKNGRNTANYLSYLLNRYRFLIRNGVFQKHEFLKTAYQKKGQNLQRVDFTPNPEDWAELKCLKAFLNISMTWIFVLLLLLDSLDLPLNLPKEIADFVVPKISRFRVEVKSIFSRKMLLYERVMWMTRDRNIKKKVN